MEGNFESILDKMREIHNKKNSDYDNAYAKMMDFAGVNAGVGIMYNKLCRFKNLYNNPTGQKVDDESIEDTLVDLANYSVMTLEYLNAHKNDKQTVKAVTRNFKGEHGFYGEVDE